jgi:hypothetical protein
MTGYGKARVFEGYGLQAVRKCLRISAALAAEGTVFFSSGLFSAACLAPEGIVSLSAAMPSAAKAGSS